MHEAQLCASVAPGPGGRRGCQGTCPVLPFPTGTASLGVRALTWAAAGLQGELEAGYTYGAVVSEQCGPRHGHFDGAHEALHQLQR